MTQLEELDLKMNLSEYDQRKLAIWETAANPDLSNGFFTFAGCYLAMVGFVGFCVNGTVLIAFFMNKSVSNYSTVVSE